MKSAKNLYVIFTLTFAMVLLTSCISMSGISPTSHLLDVNKLKAGKAIESFEQNMPWPKEDWWKSYHDAQLDLLISQAISGNPNLRIAYNRLTLVEAYRVGAHAALLPNVGADASSGLERFTAKQFVPLPWAGNTYWNNQATTSLSYDLDLWGGKQSAWKAYIDEAKASAAEVQQVKLSLITAVVREYVQLSIAYELSDIANQRLLLRQKRISLAHRALSGGIGTRINVVEAEMPLSLIRGQIEIINKHIELIKNEIAAISGQGPGAGSLITRPVILFNTQISLPSDLPANLISHRPDLLANRWHMEAASKDIESSLIRWISSDRIWASN